MDMLQEIRAEQARYAAGLAEQSRLQSVSLKELMRIERNWGAHGNSSDTRSSGMSTSGKTDAHLHLGCDDSPLLTYQL